LVPTIAARRASSRSGAAVEPGSQRVLVRLAPAEACGTLLYDAFVEVLITGNGEAARVVVPREAVTELEGVTVVFVPTEATGAFTVRPVQIFRSGPQWVYLDGGLEEGERVVDRGAILLKGEWMRGALE
jgi:membrane fusion protein, heavy metal efflux system